MCIRDSDRVGGYITGGIAAGAQVATGGGVPSEPPGPGYFMSPTVFTEVRDDMAIAQEEILSLIHI